MAVFPLFYCGNIAYWRALLEAEQIVFEVHEHFEKQTFRNRMEILGPNGIQKLVVPTLKTGERRTMKEVQISYAENWQKLHWKSLEAAYRRSPYFEYYEDAFNPFYKEKVQTLLELNKGLMDLILKLLDIPLEYSFTQEFHAEPKGTDRRSQSFSGTSEGTVFKPYLQVFTDRFPFTPNLSILDPLFNLGPQTKDYLTM